MKAVGLFILAILIFVMVVVVPELVKNAHHAGH